MAATFPKLTGFGVKSLLLSGPARIAAYLVGAILLILPTAAHAADERWVTTWGCGPQLTEPRNLPPVPLANRTLRQFVRTSIGGKQLRVRFCNAYGNSPVSIRSANIALAAGDGSAGTGEIDPATDRALTFDGAPGVVVAAGESILSDPLAFDLPVMADVAVSIHFSDISATTINGHPGSRTTSFIADGEKVSEAELPDAAKTDHWYIITGIETLGPESGRAVIVLGDSISDGRGSTTNGNDRWPDSLAKRLADNAPTKDVAVVNMGIGGNGIFGGLGPSAKNRFQRDVLGQSGARYLIVFIGVNDIGAASDADAPTLAGNIIDTYTDFANKAHARDILVYGATITPLGFYHTSARESARQTINDWIRDNSIFDGSIDFDAAVRDPSAPENLLPAYSSDGLHLNPPGYQKMADSVNLDLFTP